MPSSTWSSFGRSPSTGKQATSSGAAEWAHPEIEFVIADGRDPGTWKGLAAIARAMRDQLGVWEGYRVEAEEYRELDDERVLVLTRSITIEMHDRLTFVAHKPRVDPDNPRTEE